jgi:hypothetical protein
MTFGQFKKLVDGGLNLHPSIGIKVKQNGKDRCFFRFKPALGDGIPKIIEQVTGMIYVNNEQMLKVLDHETKFGELIFFACCCRKCHDEESKAITQKFYEQTGEAISHGYAPEHLDEEMEFLKQEMKK